LLKAPKSDDYSFGFGAFLFACIAHTTLLPHSRNFVKGWHRGEDEAVVPARSIKAN